MDKLYENIKKLFNSSPKNVDFISNSGIFSCSEIGKCSRNVAK